MTAPRNLISCNPEGAPPPEPRGFHLAYLRTIPPGYFKTVGPHYFRDATSPTVTRGIRRRSAL
jgi:hypothetical protein